MDEAESRYNIDTERVYSTGFSNGGALSVSLASEYPKRFAAISAAGWMFGRKPDAERKLRAGADDHNAVSDDGEVIKK